MPDPISRAFRKTLGRAEGLVALHPQLHGIQGRPRQHVSDILRGALVLATSALDALVLGSVVRAIPKLAKAGELGDDVTEWVRKDPHVIVKAFASRNPHEVLGQLATEKLGLQTFQRSDTIQGVLKGTIGCEAPWQRAAEALSSVGDRWTEEIVKEALDRFVERRNRIVHGGDMDQGKPRTTTIQLRYVEEALRVIRAVGEAVSAVVEERLKHSG